MMATTHACISLGLVVLSLPVTGAHAPDAALMAVAFFGGLVPDLDIASDHRKSLHFPVFLPAGAVVLGGAYAVVGAPTVLLLTVGVASAGVHSLTDILAGGVGPEPWKRTSDRAVYNHALGAWHAPRRLVRYSGAPEDFGLCAAVAFPVVLAPQTGATADAALVATLLASGLYALSRRRLSEIARRFRALVSRGLGGRLRTGRSGER
jgi:hypothetical protein